MAIHSEAIIQNVNTVYKWQISVIAKISDKALLDIAMFNEYSQTHIAY